MSEAEKVVTLVPKAAAAKDAGADAAAVESFEAAMANFAAAMESLDQGMKLLINVVTEHDKRLRALELAQRKAERRNVPAIVNSRGEKVN